MNQFIVYYQRMAMNYIHQRDIRFKIDWDQIQYEEGTLPRRCILVEYQGQPWLKVFHNTVVVDATIPFPSDVIDVFFECVRTSKELPVR